MVASVIPKEDARVSVTHGLAAEAGVATRRMVSAAAMANLFTPLLYRAGDRGDDAFVEGEGDDVVSGWMLDEDS